MLLYHQFRGVPAAPPCELAESIAVSSGEVVPTHSQSSKTIETRLRQHDYVGRFMAVAACKPWKTKQKLKNCCARALVWVEARSRLGVLVGRGFSRGAMTLNLLKSRYITSAADARARPVGGAFFDDDGVNEARGFFRLLRHPLALRKLGAALKSWPRTWLGVDFGVVQMSWDFRKRSS